MTKKESTSTAVSSTAAAATDDDVTIEVVLERLSSDLLKEFLQGNKSKKASGTKKKQVQAIMEKAEEKGSQHLMSVVTKDAETMKTALLVLEDTDDLGHENKSKMTKQIKDHFNKSTPDKFFEKLNEESLDLICQCMEFQEEGDKEAKIDALCEEVTIAGLRVMFETMAKEFIEEVATTLKLSKSGSRKKIIDRILALGYPHLKEVIEDEKSSSKRKSKEEARADAPDVSLIQKGITMEDLYQYYTEQLKQYLKDHGRVTGGNKKEMVKRILAYLDGDDEGTKAMSAAERAKIKKKRRPMSAATKKKKAAEKRKAKQAAEEGGEDAAASSEEAPAAKKQKK